MPGHQARLEPGLPLRGFVLLALVAFFWGIDWPIIKMGVLEIPPLPYRAIIFGGGGLSLFAMCMVKGYSLTVPRRLWPALLFTTACIATYQLMQSYGVILTASGRAAVMAYTFPVWTVLLGAFVLGEPIDWRKGGALVLGMGGMVLLLIADVSSIGGAPIGMILMLGTALLFAVLSVAQKKTAWGAPTLVIAAWQISLSTVPMAIGAAFTDYSDVAFPSGLAIFSVVYNIFIGVAFCMWAYFEVIRLFPVGIAAISAMMTPVVGVFAGAIMLGEPLGATEFGALVLIGAAIGLPVLTRRQSWRRDQEAVDMPKP